MARPLQLKKDPLGHSVRFYEGVYQSPVWKAISHVDRSAYGAIMQGLKGSNNGDLSLTLRQAEAWGISHHVTLARSLRALCAIGLIAITRKGGCTKGGQRLPTLYRVTLRESSAYPLKGIESHPATNDWKKYKTVEEATARIDQYEKENKRGAGRALDDDDHDAHEKWSDAATKDIS